MNASKFRKFLGDVETRRVVSRISSFHVTWLAGDITIPFILPLMPTVTHIFPQPQHFPEYRGRRFTKLFFSSGRTHINTVMLELSDSRISRLSRVVNTNCRSVIGFFGRVVGSSWLPRRTTYPELRLWQTSGTHPRRILENPRACLLHATYTQAGITDKSLSARCGSGSRYFELPSLASRARFSLSASAYVRVMQSLFFTPIYRRVYRSILLEKYTSSRRFYVIDEE